VYGTSGSGASADDGFSGPGGGGRRSAWVSRVSRSGLGLVVPAARRLSRQALALGTRDGSRHLVLWRSAVPADRRATVTDISVIPDSVDASGSDYAERLRD
jgi:hypothetical protein